MSVAVRTSPSPLLTAALQYAARGWPVVPLHTPGPDGACSCRAQAACPHSGKHPRFHPQDLPTGLHAATTDPARIQRWWRRWPRANIGIATGPRSGLLVVDLDGPTGLVFPPTAMVVTHAGQHHYFQHPGHSVRNRVRLLPQLDIRADHALVVAPPSRHASGQRYTWQPYTTPAPVPRWLQAHLRPLSPPQHDHPRPRSQPYAEAVLRGELQRLGDARPGTRNTTLNWVAFRCGQFVGTGHLDHCAVEHSIAEVALQLGLGPREVAATLRSGLRAGMRAARRG